MREAVPRDSCMAEALFGLVGSFIINGHVSVEILRYLSGDFCKTFLNSSFGDEFPLEK